MVLVAPDSFKGSLTATEAARAISLGVRDLIRWMRREYKHMRARSAECPNLGQEPRRIPEVPPVNQADRAPYERRAALIRDVSCPAHCHHAGPLFSAVQHVRLRVECR